MRLSVISTGDHLHFMCKYQQVWTDQYKTISAWTTILRSLSLTTLPMRQRWDNYFGFSHHHNRHRHHHNHNHRHHNAIAIVTIVNIRISSPLCWRGDLTCVSLLLPACNMIGSRFLRDANVMIMMIMTLPIWWSWWEDINMMIMIQAMLRTVAILHQGEEAIKVIYTSPHPEIHPSHPLIWFDISSKSRVRRRSQWCSRQKNFVTGWQGEDGSGAVRSELSW